MDLAAYTLYLPNRRAARAMRDAFLRVSPGGAILLPRLRSLGDADEDIALLSGEAETGAPLDLPECIGQLERRMMLTSYVLAWSKAQRRSHKGRDAFPALTVAAACELALELTRLLDQAQTEQADLTKIGELIPEHFADHWQLTAKFLKIVIDQWPSYLRRQGLTDRTARHNRLMALEAERLAAGAQDTPVIIAGSTGSVPATAGLMQTVMGLPHGAIVLPGLDLELDEASWEALERGHPEHPQFGLRRLLGRLGRQRTEVRLVPGTEPSAPAAARLAFIREALRPAETTHLWQDFIRPANSGATRQGLQNISLIAAPAPQDEAEIIALIFRHTAERAGKTASLVTPDRELARRVAALLERWDISIDDSAGQTLKNSRPGAFFDLIAQVAQNGGRAAILSLLKHPLTRLGLPRAAVLKRARALELIALRQPWCGAGLAGAARSIELTRRAIAAGEMPHPALKRLSAAQWREAEHLLASLQDAFAPFMALRNNGKGQRLHAFASAHAQAAAAMARDEEGNAAELAAGAAGEAMTQFMDCLSDNAVPGPEIAFPDYPALFRSLIRREVVRGALPAHPRLAIWGPLEARLQQPDVAILGGLNEGAWPQEADPGPWLNRPMREALGLPPPERRIGLSAHDFTQLLGCREVFLTRSLKIGGVPAAPSRWLLRMETLLQSLGLGEALKPALPWLDWAAAKRRPKERKRIAPPAPRPPVAARPRRLSVTETERWIANPYAIFARRILQLEPLPSLEVEPDDSHRGRIIHQALSLFTDRFPGALPPDTAAELVCIADELMARFQEHPRVRAFWRPRLERFASWFAGTEAERRAAAVKLCSEVTGGIALHGPGGTFKLTARADRIDLLRDGRLAIYDYKSGAIPNANRVYSLHAPQLPLEALIAMRGGFHGLAAAEAASLAYISAKGGEPAGKEMKLSKEKPEALALAAEKGLVALIERFDRAETPYAALRRPDFADTYRYDVYAHLARVKEWAGEAGAED